MEREESFQSLPDSASDFSFASDYYEASDRRPLCEYEEFRSLSWSSTSTGVSVVSDGPQASGRTSSWFFGRLRAKKRIGTADEKMKVVPVTSAVEKKVTLSSLEGKKFEVPEAVAMVSGTWRNLIENGDRVITVNQQAPILAQVIEYCRKHAKFPNGSDVEEMLKSCDDWDSHFVKVSEGVLIDLFWAARSLKITSLEFLVSQNANRDKLIMSFRAAQIQDQEKRSELFPSVPFDEDAVPFPQMTSESFREMAFLWSLPLPKKPQMMTSESFREMAFLWSLPLPENAC